MSSASTPSPRRDERALPRACRAGHLPLLSPVLYETHPARRAHFESAASRLADHMNDHRSNNVMRSTPARWPGPSTSARTSSRHRVDVAEPVGGLAAKERSEDRRRSIVKLDADNVAHSSETSGL